MRTKWLIFLGTAMLTGAVGAALLGPAPASAVNRDLVELQTAINQVLQGQQALQIAIVQNDAVQKQLIGQVTDSVNKLSGTFGGLQKSMQDLQATSGARLDSMSTQIQGVSDNLQEALARMGKLNQQLTDAQNAIQTVEAKLASAPPPAPAPPPTAAAPSGPNGSMVPAAPSALPPSAAPGATSPNGVPTPGAGIPSAAAEPAVPPTAPATARPSADLLYSNALRDLNGKNYDLSQQEFQDYLKYYSGTDLAGNAQFYLGEIAFAQGQYKEATDYYNTVITNYSHSFKVAPARLKKGLALVSSGQTSSGIAELKTVVRLFPGTDEERRARAKLHELGVTS